MRFFIKRESVYDGKPCDAAVRVSYFRRDERTDDCPTKIPFYAADPAGAVRWWQGEGANHRVENGKIVRDMPIEGWAVEIPFVDGLIYFLDTYGPLRITKSDSVKGEPLLTLEDE